MRAASLALEDVVPDEALEKLLLDAMDERRCPICSVLEALLFDEMCALQAAVPDDDAATADSVGYCSEHLWYLQELSSSTTSAGRLAPLVERTAARLAEAATRTADNFVRGDASQVAAALEVAASCRVCLWGARTEDAVLRVMVDTLAVPAHRERYSETPGVCLPHLCRVMEATDKREFATWLLREAAGQLARLGRQLRALTREHAGIGTSTALPRAAAEALAGARRRAVHR